MNNGPVASRNPAADSACAPLLRVENLSVCFDTVAGVVHATRGVEFDVSRGDIVAIVGESGSGKSVTALSLLNLISRPPGRYASGKIVFDGTDILTLSDRALSEIRGRRIGMIFQNPRAALNPAFTALDQMAETVSRHRPDLSPEETRKVCIRSLRDVGFSDPDRVASSYPAQLSGGMCQRVSFAMVMACRPELVIADEPTTALDVLVQARMLKLLKEANERDGLPIIVITHDFGVVRAIASKVMVMYAGQIVETGETDQVVESPKHPYTAALIRSVPNGGETVDRLYQIEGQPPELIHLAPGCPFADRCDEAVSECFAEPPPVHRLSCGGTVRCHRRGSMESLS